MKGGLVLSLSRGAGWNVLYSSPGFCLCELPAVPQARHSENEKHAAGDHSWGVRGAVCHWAGAGSWQGKNLSGPTSAAVARKCSSSRSPALLAAFQVLKQMRRWPYNQISLISPLNMRAGGKRDALGLYGMMQILSGAKTAQGAILQSKEKPTLNPRRKT